MDNSKEIVERLDILISLLIPPYNAEKYKTGHDVLPFCDGYYTIRDIAEKTGKTKKAIETSIERLKEKGFIKSITKDSKTYYIRLT